jgi:hypothetical protein
MNKIAELRSQLEGKQAELDAIVTKDDPSTRNSRRPISLRPTWRRSVSKIDKYNADKKKLADLKSKSDGVKAHMKEIVRPRRSRPS